MTLTPEQRRANVRAIRRVADDLERSLREAETAVKVIDDLTARLPALRRKLEALLEGQEEAVAGIRRVFEAPEGAGGDEDD